ncbi:MAG: Zn-ribbon domain-containing OB-fold protein [Candidatus Odinarchaeum yellowstonii]|uniref:Zn-ribbon domain-containing OB-fold protein n=1 Tax=Odinarchaeota yellowstonii (strain LCB_4) TaxID=1841599 RepID=A0AAF0D315_ODILC|nr:MAG: Zn-ribbon domain-containing OB-fold protein [Candidatus Odinarchaeum yellowstonii]
MEADDFSIKRFLKYISEGKLKGLKCSGCANIIAPPRLKCSVCGSSEFEWVNLSGKARLLTYTIIHVAPKRFASESPYAVGIVQLEEGPKLEARITGFDINQHAQILKAGTELVFAPNPAGILSFKPLI